MSRSPSFRNSRSVIAGLLLGTLFSLGGCADREQEQARQAAAEHRFLADSYIRQGKLGAAMIELQNAEQLIPGDSDTIALMAENFAAVGALEQAEQLYARLIAADKLASATEPAYLRLLIRRGRFSKVLEYTGDKPAPQLAGIRAQALLGTGQRSAAMALAEDTLARQPDNLDALICRASALFLENDAEAFQTSLEALSAVDNADAWLWRARLEQGREQHEAAIMSLSRAMPFFAQHDIMTANRFEALRRMMQSLISLGRADEAMTYSGMIANSSAGQLLNRYEDGVSLLRDGNLDGASETFRDILARSPGHSSSALALGMISLQQGNYQDAEQYLSTAVAGGSNNASALKYLIAVLLQREDLDAAEQHLAKGLQDFPDDADLPALQGLVLQRRGRHDEAAALFQRALAAQPGNVGAHISLGQIALAKGNAEQAERYFRQALAIRPQAADALRGLVMVADLRGQRPAGFTQLRQSLGALKNADLWLMSAMLALQFDDEQGARSDIASALLLAPDHTRGRAMLGALDYQAARSAFSASRYQDAERLAEQALRSLPGDFRVLLLKASAATARGDGRSALAVADQVKALGDNLHRGFELEGDIHTQLGDQQAALRAYANAWQRHRNSILAGKYLGALRQTGNDGLAMLLDWTRAEPDNAEAWLSLASAQQSAGKTAAAASSYQRVDALIPGNAGVLNNLAWLYHEAGDPRAAATAAKAYALAPDNPAIADTYGWILVHSGERARGIRLLEQAAAAAPDDADIRAHLERARNGG
jgi:tetratricopeptide (TPR) repeat protein